ncbi:MAG: hypothetical protein FWH20_05210 [Oscillospiraceae bacterium]|nr:hypothetical protein [Oscillospiraceae bacterium]
MSAPPQLKLQAAPPPHKPFISHFLDMKLFPLATFRFAVIKKSVPAKGFSAYEIFMTRELCLNKCKSGWCKARRSVAVAQT